MSAENKLDCGNAWILIFKDQLPKKVSVKTRFRRQFCQRVKGGRVSPDPVAEESGIYTEKSGCCACVPVFENISVPSFLLPAIIDLRAHQR